MADRSVKVTLRANVQDFKSQIGQAASSLDDLAQKGDKTGQASQTMMGRVTQSMQLQREQWTTAGTALTVMGTAITGVGVAALTTGINYNTLQQTSRAALSTITGSAEEANRQMDKLDEFASTSPFAKDVFIRAQQQMLGFGIEAQKVIPYMDAIQQSVAATGGSNNDIAELSAIFSKVSASAKITAQDLNEFGNRGIDAATLIGSQMGMTGAQIREEITAGSLDAGQALDALASGMQERFGGAADNVKNTITGSFDRVKAAWRDLSGDLAAPLVGPDGGGLMVGLLNQVADLMRAFQGLPDPIKNTVAALGGLAGVGSLAAGGFLLLAPRVMDSVVAFKALRDLNLVSMAGGLSGVAASIAKFALPAAAFAGVMALHDALNGISEGDYGDVESLADALRDVADGGTTASDALTLLGTVAGSKGLFTNEITNMTELLDNLAPTFEKAFGDSTLNKIERFMDSPGDPVGKANEKIRMLNDALIDLWNSGDEGAATESYEQLVQLLLDSGMAADEAAEALAGFIEVSGTKPPGVDMLPLLTGPMSDLLGITQDTTGATDDLTDAEEELADAWERQIGSIGDLIDHRRRLAGEAMSIIDAEVAHREAAEGLTGALEDQSIAFDTTTGRFDGYAEAGETAHKASQDYAQSMWDVAEAMYASGASQDEVLERMNEMRDEYVNQVSGLQGVGDKAGEVADQYHMFPEEIATSFDLDSTEALDALEIVEGRLVELDGTELKVDGNTVPLTDSVAETLGLIADENGEVTIDGNTVPATTTWQELLAMIAGEEGITTINADDSLAQDVLHMFGGDVAAAEEFAKINANDQPGQDVLAYFRNDVDSSFEQVGIGGNDSVGQDHLAYFRRDIDRSFEEVDVGGNTSPGRLDVSRLISDTKTKSTSVSVKANTTSFRNTLAGIVNRVMGSATVNITGSYRGASGLASGGYVSGPGTATSDSIPAWLSNGEYVIKANSVAKYGKSFFDQLNAGRYAQGGYVSARSVAAPVVNVASPSVTLPNEVVLVDADGSLLTRARWIAREEYERGATTTGRWS